MLVGQAQNQEVHNLTRASYSQNEEIKRISGWGGHLLRAQPHRHNLWNELRQHARAALDFLGYPFALVLMVLTSAGLYMLFKRLGWL